MWPAVVAAALAAVMVTAALVWLVLSLMLTPVLTFLPPLALTLTPEETLRATDRWSAAKCRCGEILGALRA
jgi:hypothetical protein